MANSKPQAPRKPRLGRGLSSLIVNSAQTPSPADSSYVSEEPAPQPPATAPGKAPIIQPAGPQQIGVDAIAPNPYQPRREFAEEQLAELAESISRQGVLQPLIVCKSSDLNTHASHLLIAGERRLRAAKRAGLESVPCIVRSASPQEMLEWALVENIQRSDLGTMEKARAYQEYIDRFQLTQADAAERLGQARATVSNYIRMLDLEDSVQQLLSDGTLTFGHGKALASLAGRGEAQRKLARRIAAEGLSVRQAEQLAAAIANGDGETAQPKRAVRPKVAYLLDVEEQLTQTVGTRVRVHPGRAKHSGRIVVEYYNLDDFDRIAGCLGLRNVD